MSKRDPEIIVRMGRLKSATLKRMTDRQLEYLRGLSECLQVMCAMELARRDPGRAVLVRETSIFQKQDGEFAGVRDI